MCPAEIRRIDIRNRIIIGISVLIVLSNILPVNGATTTQATPYLCDECYASFFSESPHIHHMSLVHETDLGIEGDLPPYEPYRIVFKAYLPVLYYFDPETGRGFYTEPEFVNWMNNH